MIIKDKRELTGFNTPKMPKFKGHVKITLHNCRTGKNEVIEGENIVTNAVKDLLAANHLGAVDYSKIFGSEGLWKKWYGGVLLYEQFHPTTEVGGVDVLDPDDYFPRADNVNHLWAHAGQNSIDPNHDDDLTRGNPVSAAFVSTEDTIKQVWEWGSARGNQPDGRYIRALSLTHADTGDAGLGSDTYAFQNYKPLEIINTSIPDGNVGTRTLVSGDVIYFQYDDSHGGVFAVGEDAEMVRTAYPESNKVTIYIRKLPYKKAGLYQTWSANESLQKVITVTTSVTFYGQPCYYFDYANKKLWLFSNLTSKLADNQWAPTGKYSSSVINYTVLDLSDLTNVTEDSHGTITSDTSDIAPVGWSARYENTFQPHNFSVLKSGNYFYFPIFDSFADYSGSTRLRIKGYKKVNITNQADQSSIPFNGIQDNTRPLHYCGGLAIADNFVINGNNGFACSTDFGDPSRLQYYASRPDLISTYQILGGYVESRLQTVYKRISASKMVNTTLFNLPTPVQKTASQSMTVEYTLTEVEDE